MLNSATDRCLILKLQWISWMFLDLLDLFTNAKTAVHPYKGEQMSHLTQLPILIGKLLWYHWNLTSISLDSSTWEIGKCFLKEPDSIYFRLASQEEIFKVLHRYLRNYLQSNHLKLLFKKHFYFSGWTKIGIGTDMATGHHCWPPLRWELAMVYYEPHNTLWLSTMY